MYNKFIYNIKPMGFTWETSDPFLFCVHHLDNYPAGNGKMGPAASLEGRNLGQDFVLKDGWRMYHGEQIPGFPAHPHRGFETVTVVLKGMVDHSDSHGAAGRYGNGDVQWMTAGAGLQHSEMMPLLNTLGPNPLELFQIWLNLPAKSKFAQPHFKMLWAEEIPVLEIADDNGKNIQIRIIAGSFNEVAAPAPAPDSWAADKNNEVAIWLITMQPDARLALPRANFPVNRSLYFYKGSHLKMAGIEIPPYHSVSLSASDEILIENGISESGLLLLQGKPIGEPVIQHGPFVMNTMQEIYSAFSDFRETGFGGWPWDSYENGHAPEKGRFARYSNGTTEQK